MQEENINLLPLKHPKYGYNMSEMFLMVIITGFTNFAVIPALIGLYRQRLLLQFHMGILTVTCSFMYHFIDSLPIDTIIINIGEWHRLGKSFRLMYFR
jgi:hypothetical protein